jgi:predicted  nucleic acid-binding Zn-ribbon protein
VEPPAAEPRAVTSPRTPSRGLIAACVLVGGLGLLLAVQAIAGARRSLQEDAREEILPEEERSPAELEVDRLLHETERLEAEKAQLVRENAEIEERLAALSARAPEMPLIETVVQSAEGDTFVGLAAGTDEKVEKGFQFSITRNKKFVARVVVQIVGARACACRILVVKEGDRIRVGDVAATRLQ